MVQCLHWNSLYFYLCKLTIFQEETLSLQLLRTSLICLIETPPTPVDIVKYIIIVHQYLIYFRFVFICFNINVIPSVAASSCSSVNGEKVYGFIRSFFFILWFYLHSYSADSTHTSHHLQNFLRRQHTILLPHISWVV